MTKHPRARSQGLITILNVKVYDCTVKKNSENMASLEEFANTSLKKDMLAELVFAKLHLKQRLLEQCSVDRQEQSGDVWP